MLLAQQFKIIHYKTLEVDQLITLITFILLKCSLICIQHLYITVEQLMFHNK